MAKEEYSPFDAPVKGNPIPYKDRLKKSLEKAVEKESYEDSVILRDALFKLENGKYLSPHEKIICDNILYPTPTSSLSDEFSPFDTPVKES